MVMIHRFREKENFLFEIERATVENIQKTLERQKFCTLGLAGGSSPCELYKRLASADLPWSRVRFIQIDERYVPSHNPESNQRMIQKTLVSKIPIPTQNLLFFDTALTQEEAAQGMSKKLESLIRKQKGSSKKQKNLFLFDLLILGAGRDGHVASLFNKDPKLKPGRWASSATAKGYKTEARLTLTLKALAKARQALLLLTGEEKKHLLKNFKKFPILSELLKSIPTKLFYCE